jgi:hypothetical protein
VQPIESKEEEETPKLISISLSVAGSQHFVISQNTDTAHHRETLWETH